MGVGHRTCRSHGKSSRINTAEVSLEPAHTLAFLSGSVTVQFLGAPLQEKFCWAAWNSSPRESWAGLARSLKPRSAQFAHFGASN